MANDYFEDITPEGGTPIRYTPAPKQDASLSVSEQTKVSTSEKTIRNVASPRSRSRVGASPPPPPPPPAQRGSGAFAFPPEERRTGRKGILVWVAAGLSLALLAGAAVFAFRGTSVSVTPRTQTVTFDSSLPFSAFPASLAATGTLAYSVQESDIEDSAVVPAQGVEKAEEKAMGTITVFNEYSAQSVRLIKNTRFESANGLIFRIPESVMVPGKKGGTPGQISVTVFADQTGDAYNIAPTNFTVPGLKSTPDMYKGVYARSTESFSGGFSGERPAVAPGALESARAEVRGRLEEKAREAAQAASAGDAIVFPSLVRVTYQSMPHTSEAGGGVRIHEKAHLVIPLFTATSFAEHVASSVSADVSGPVRLDRGSSVQATITPEELVKVGSESFQFGLEGSGVLVWEVDAATIAQALAGRDKSAFETIIAGFTAVQKAKARIAPLWKGTFPESPEDITIEVSESGAN